MKKTLIFVSVLAVVMFLVSSCVENSPPDPQLSRPATSMLGGGGSGTDIPVGTENLCAESYLVGEGDSFNVGEYYLEIGSIFSNAVEVSVGNTTTLIGENRAWLINDGLFVAVKDINLNSNDPTLSRAVLKTCT
ncbi:MAG: hypothetical protein ABIJ20_04935 [Nanoarchaeota archaeon]|nr:hypothetical protein [Nanoarchaeota archaeon]MBU1444969.1 hypothetical protein [Nanoarchaeota archaeon]MBU2406689.1 hypothetical protein [Nanoarchaeota archaeon]MBU2420409.1 hypothetical protein [Nanoarchaeota archaeon]MBU2475723.1 hypothetical protein [Nanoarchaeota archaeon]